MTLRWPTAPEAVLLWAEVVLAWTLVSYVLTGNDPVIEKTGPDTRKPLRGGWKKRVWGRPVLLLAFLTFTLPWNGVRTLLLSGCLLAFSLLLPHARVWLAERDHRVGAELEILANLLVVVLSAHLLANSTTGPRHALLQASMPSPRLAALCLAGAVLVFLARGGTHIVRGILAKADAMPLRSQASGVPPDLDVKEYSRGRIIGTIERLIMTAVVAASAYSALMFLIGAKGLIRSKELEDHAFAEYFLIGTLASAALAIVAGFLLQLTFHTLW